MCSGVILSFFLLFNHAQKVTIYHNNSISDQKSI